MKIAYNPISAGALTSAPSGNYLNAITFDLAGHNIFTRGVMFKGTDTTYKVFKKHTASSNTGGYNGLVPVPNYNDNSTNRFLREDSTWALPLQRIIKVNDTTILSADAYNKALNLSAGNWIKLTNNNGKVTIDTTFEVDNNFTGVVENPFTDVKVDGTNLSADTTRILNINSGVGIELTPDATDNSILITAPIYKGATASANGKEGIVPAPTKNNLISYLRSNGAWSNIVTEHIVDLTGYAIFTTTTQSNLVLKTTDSLNTALGKLENKANLGMSAYNWYKSITAEDTDGYINKWQEIVDFLNEVKNADGDILDQFVTVATEQTVTGAKTFASATTLQSTLSVTGATTMGSNLTIKGNITPNGNNTYNLGSETNIWNTVYASNFVGDLTGIADKAIVLKTGRKINGTTFDGSKDIVTEYWGTARNINITDGTNKGTATSINGSQNYELKLPTTIIASIIGDVTGKADSATVLKTKRKINGTDFDGSADITTEYWGTARTLTITDGTNKGTATSIDGSQNYTLDLPDVISADIIGDLDGTAAVATKLGTDDKGSAIQGIYLAKGVATAMTYSLNATVNSGAQNKLAYYSGTNAISPYGSKGDATTPIYLNNGVPTECGSYDTLFTDLSNNTTDGKLSLTIGGTTKSIVVNYAANAGNASSANKVNKTLTFKPGSYGTEDHTFNGSNDLTVYIPSVKGDIGLGNVQNTAFYKKVVTVNGTTHNMAGTDSNAAFGIYAPISSGTTGYILSAKSNNAPEWIKQSDITAGKLGTDAGSSTNPVYFAGGIPVACTYSLKATLNGGAAGAVAYYSGANAVSKHPGAGGSNQPVYIDTNGVVQTCNTYGSLFTKLANEDNQLVVTVGGTTKSLTIAYSSVAGKLGTADKGDTYTPIYLKGGTATVGTSYAKAIKSITRSAHTCTCTHIDDSTSTFSLPQLSLTQGEGNYVSSISASGHTITVTRANLPTLSVVDNGTGTFVTDVTASGHTVTLTRGNVPGITINTTGTGNAITSLSASGHTITATKGSTFSLNGHSHSTLTFSAGSFAATSYDGTAAVTVKVPTHTSHLTNNSGFLTSRGYIGTTAVQASSAAQALTGITTISASSTITAGGNITAPHFYESSDIALKTNIKTIDSFDNIPVLKEFDWKEDGSHSYGLIAQELEALGYTELVNTKEDGYKTVNYSAALSLIVGKLQNKIAELEKEIEILKNK